MTYRPIAVICGQFERIAIEAADVRVAVVTTAYARHSRSHASGPAATAAIDLPFRELELRVVNA